MSSSSSSGPSAEWQIGSKLLHPFNPELGVGVVRKIEGRFLAVVFPRVDREVTLSAAADGLHRLVLPPGARAVLIESEEEVEVAEARGHGYLLADGREVDDAQLWPLEAEDTPVERLAQLRLDAAESLQNRISGLELMQLREAGGLGSFLGGRIELFPHQLFAAEKAVAQDPVRWLFADEVGLGKTVEACLVLSALVRTGRAERALVIAPSTLAVQWLGELYRKFHQIFVLLDQDRVESVETDYGEGVNPFEVHPYAVVSLEYLASDGKLLRQAKAAGLELVVVDEAHRLAHSRWLDAIGPLVRDANHALLLTATPLQADRDGFYTLLEMLHPERFPSLAGFEASLASGDAQLECTSAVQRVEVGGLPPRVAVPVTLGEAERPTTELSDDARTRWLVERAKAWRKSEEKALVFVRDRDTLDALCATLEREAGTRVARFHEDMSIAKRDIEVASFRDSSMGFLVSTEAGAEGRNFQFCERMVHFDLPGDPVELEQRIGRLDRIGRRTPVEIVYFHQAGDGPPLAALYERLELFERAAAGLDVALDGVRDQIAAAADGGPALDVDAIVTRVAAARENAQRDVVRVFYPDAYRAGDAQSVLDRVPENLDDANRAFCVAAAEDLGVDNVEKGGHGMHYFELGSKMTIEGLPGVPGESRFLGTFDREEAVEMEEIDFFASGHPLVEGLLLELEDGVRGRAGLLQLPDSCGFAGAGLACVYKDGAEWGVSIIEANGTQRPEWVPGFLAALPRASDARPEAWGLDDSWGDALRALAAHAEYPGDLVSIAFFRVM